MYPSVSLNEVTLYPFRKESPRIGHYSEHHPSPLPRHELEKKLTALRSRKVT